MRVAVIGGGFAGMGCALKLAAKHEVLLLEKSDRLGGVASSVDYNGHSIPWGSHWILSTDTALVELVKEVGLGSKLKWKEVPMGFYYKGRTYGMTGPLSVLRYRPLPFTERLRFGLFALRLRLSRGKWEKRLEGESARKWLSEEASREICDSLFEPLSKIKFNRSLESISASWLYNRLVDTTKGGATYCFLDGGFQALVDSVSRRISGLGGEIRTGADVRKIITERGKVKAIEFVQDGRKQTLSADAVVSAVPTPVLLGLAEFPRDFRERLSRIRYKQIVNAFFILKRKLAKEFDWINFCYDDLPFGGMLEHDLKDYTGKEGSLAYLFTYTDGSGKLWKASDEEIRKTYTDSLESIFPGAGGLVEGYRVSRSDLAWPIYDKDYANSMPGHITPITGLFLAGIYLTYPKMPSVGAAVESGYKAAELVSGYLDGGHA